MIRIAPDGVCVFLKGLFFPSRPKPKPGQVAQHHFTVRARADNANPNRSGQQRAYEQFANSVEDLNNLLIQTIADPDKL